MPPSEHELRLRERLGRLKNLPLVGGARLSGVLVPLQRHIDRIWQLDQIPKAKIRSRPHRTTRKDPPWIHI